MLAVGGEGSRGGACGSRVLVAVVVGAAGRVDVALLLLLLAARPRGGGTTSLLASELGLKTLDFGCLRGLLECRRSVRKRVELSNSHR